MSIPKLKQGFRTEYKICQDGKTIVCYVTPLNYIPFLNFCLEVQEVVRGTTIQTECRRQYGQFKGVARFKDGDNYNIEVGKKIARKKAMRAYFQHLKSEYLSSLNEVLELINQRKTFIEQADEKINTLTDEIKELTK